MRAVRPGSSNTSQRIPTRIVPSAAPDPRSPRAILNEFDALLANGMELRPLGTARSRPSRLRKAGYVPQFRIDLFDTRYYLCRVRQNEDLRFFVAYVVQPAPRGSRLLAHPRIFYKDISLVWRSASHFVRSDDENWVGKGDVTTVVENGVEMLYSAEETTDLPFEIQTAIESLIHHSKRIPKDEKALELILRRGHDDRVEPYADFSAPRRRAQANPLNRVNRGRPIARFTRKNDPTSLRITPGFEPDFDEGVLEVAETGSKLYGGRILRYRILSVNQRIQWLFVTGPKHVWIIPPQALTTELMSYGVRTVDVLADDDLFIPGFEYHFEDDDGEETFLHSQIPEGFVGAENPFDPSRADASPWLDQIPVVQEFRRKLGASKGRRRKA